MLRVLTPFQSLFNGFAVQAELKVTGLNVSEVSHRWRVD